LALLAAHGGRISFRFHGAVPYCKKLGCILPKSCNLWTKITAHPADYKDFIALCRADELKTGKGCVFQTLPSFTFVKVSQSIPFITDVNS